MLGVDNEDSAEDGGTALDGRGSVMVDEVGLPPNRKSRPSLPGSSPRPGMLPRVRVIKKGPASTDTRKSFPTNLIADLLVSTLSGLSPSGDSHRDHAVDLLDRGHALENLIDRARLQRLHS
jgi:hypothetical protein